MDPLAVAAAFVAQRFPSADVVIAAGSRVRGDSTPTSDVDLLILMPGLQSEHRESHLHAGLPIEAFVHNENSCQRYFASDCRRGCPALPQMCVEGTVLVDRSGKAAVIKREAEVMLATGPAPMTPEEVDLWRYRITDLLDDVTDARHPAGLFVANTLVLSVAEFQLRFARHWWGRGKWLWRHLHDWDAATADGLVEAWEHFCKSRSPAQLVAYCERALLPAGGRLFDGFRQGGPGA